MGILLEKNGLVLLCSGRHRATARGTAPLRTDGADNERDLAAWVHDILQQIVKEHMILAGLSVPNPTRVANATSIVALDGGKGRGYEGV
ncbi:hypothetical protein [Roseovarius mucosus]|uniref:hypothetical protein n=1 Tax=Roseovarius mucosus TaxID=215743 RepID=UPI0035D02E9A